MGTMARTCASWRRILEVVAVLGVLLAVCNAIPAAPQVNVAAFNIRVFGDSKSSDTVVMDVLGDIIRNYHLVLVQEIKDVDMNAPTRLLDEVNSEGPGDYLMSLSIRLGTSSQKEQYAYLYRSSKFTLNEAFVYDDVMGVFERAPYIAEFTPVDDVMFPIAFVGLHAKPDVMQTDAELTELSSVRTSVASHFMHDNIVLFGDFNADCTYVSAADMLVIPIFNDATLTSYISSSADTTTTGSDCAYDRVFATSSVNEKAVGSGVFLFDVEYGLTAMETDDVSDHYPVFLTLEFEAAMEEEEEEDECAVASISPALTASLRSIGNAFISLDRKFTIEVELECEDELTTSDVSIRNGSGSAPLAVSSSKRALGNAFVVEVTAECNGSIAVCVRGECAFVNFVGCLSRVVPGLRL